MPRASPIQFNLNAGEWSPLLAARIDQERYGNSLSLCRNFLPMVQGGVTRRPGTRFIREAERQASDGNDPDGNLEAEGTRLIPFQFNVEQSYVLEFGTAFIRIYTQDGILLDGGGSPIQVTPPDMVVEDLRGLSYAQSADQLYFCAPTVNPQIISRESATSWSIADFVPKDGPYQPVNTTDITAEWDGSVIAFSGEVVESVSADPLVRIRVPDDEEDPANPGTPHPNQGKWLWGRLNAVFDTNQYTLVAGVGTLGDAPAISATPEWRIGVWGVDDFPNENFPTVVTFYQNRLWFGGTRDEPQRLDGSVIAEFDNFAPTDPDGTVNADNAISVTLQSDEVNAIRWLVSEERGLTIGTQGREWILRPASSQSGLAPDNVELTASTRYGSAKVRPIRVGEVTLFIQRDTRTLRELVFVFENDGFRAPDLTVLSEHLMRAGIREIAYQQSPQKILWAVTEDGKLLSFTYERDQNVIGWAQHELGGTDVKVQSVAVIPSSDALTDEVWLVVSRVIGGTRVWHIEKMMPMRLGGEDVEDSWYLDAALDYEGSPTAAISGLDHLEGETVSILADGAVHPNKTVSGGSITLDYEASRVIVGLPYKSRMRTQPIEAGAADGTAQGKIKRLHRVIFRLFESVGMKVGPRENKTDRITFRSTGDDIDEAVPLFTGDKFVDWDGDYETQGWVYVEQDQPLPLTVLAIMPQLLTQDGG